MEHGDHLNPLQGSEANAELLDTEGQVADDECTPAMPSATDLVSQQNDPQMLNTSHSTGRTHGYSCAPIKVSHICNSFVCSRCCG